jgi:hypothetical protein
MRIDAIWPCSRERGIGRTYIYQSIVHPFATAVVVGHVSLVSSWFHDRWADLTTLTAVREPVHDPKGNIFSFRYLYCQFRRQNLLPAHLYLPACLTGSLWFSRSLVGTDPLLRWHWLAYPTATDLTWLAASAALLSVIAAVAYAAALLTDSLARSA